MEFIAITFAIICFYCIYRFGIAPSRRVVNNAKMKTFANFENFDKAVKRIYGDNMKHETLHYGSLYSDFEKGIYIRYVIKFYTWNKLIGKLKISCHVHDSVPYSRTKDISIYTGFETKDGIKVRKKTSVKLPLGENISLKDNFRALSHLHYIVFSDISIRKLHHLRSSNSGVYTGIIPSNGRKHSIDSSWSPSDATGWNIENY